MCINMQTCQYCGQEQIDSHYKMCTCCRQLNTKAKREERAKVRKEKKYYCETCDYAAIGNYVMRRHCRSQRHQIKLFEKEAQRLMDISLE